MAEGKKNRKYGKNSKYCKLYRDLGLRERNRLRRMRRHIRKNPNDTVTYQRFFSFGGKPEYLHKFTTQTEKSRGERNEV
jgi:hypothetical protein